MNESDESLPAPVRRLAFRVSGRPCAKQRARVVRQGGRTRAFTPEATESYEAVVAGAAMEAMSAHGWDRVPKGVCVRVELSICTDTRGGDLDNVVKAVFDGLSKAGVWDDDRQVRGADPLTVHHYLTREDGIRAADAGVDVLVVAPREP